MRLVCDTRYVSLVQPKPWIVRARMMSIVAMAYLRDIVVLAKGFQLGIELADAILVGLAGQSRHLLRQLRTV